MRVLHHPLCKRQSAQPHIEELCGSGVFRGGTSEIVLAARTSPLRQEWQNIGLIDVIESLQNIQSVARIRLGSLPKIFAVVCVLLQNCTKYVVFVCLQSGSEIPAAMGRRYSARSTRKLRRYLHEFSDLFADHRCHCRFSARKKTTKNPRFCRNIGFAKIHVFPYSKRYESGDDGRAGGQANQAAAQ